ncbi:Uncharacterized protein Fot_42579 [Forsythia ovata]|uniref:Uncharacterized protein n=1 Tax=Forsythia ovata TaxID=205694 RepID=A0ABD1RLK6_9LAMI
MTYEDSFDSNDDDISDEPTPPIVVISSNEKMEGNSTDQLVIKKGLQTLNIYEAHIQGCGILNSSIPIIAKRFRHHFHFGRRFRFHVLDLHYEYVTYKINN